MPIARNTDIIGDVLLAREARDFIELLPRAQRTTNFIGSDITSDEIERASRLIIWFDIFDVTGTTPQLIIAIQPNINGKYFNLIRTGTITAPKTMISHVRANNGNNADVLVQTDPAAGSGVLADDFGVWRNTLRVKGTITGTTPMFDFSVSLFPIRSFG